MVKRGTPDNMAKSLGSWVGARVSFPASGGPGAGALHSGSHLPFRAGRSHQGAPSAPPPCADTLFLGRGHDPAVFLSFLHLSAVPSPHVMDTGHLPRQVTTHRCLELFSAQVPGRLLGLVCPRPTPSRCPSSRGRAVPLL